MNRRSFLFGLLGAAAPLPALPMVRKPAAFGGATRQFAQLWLRGGPISVPLSECRFVWQLDQQIVDKVLGAARAKRGLLR